MVPHNRHSSDDFGYQFNTRRVQRNWAINHADYNSQIFLGWHYQDVRMVTEIYGVAQAGTTNTITLSASERIVGSENPTYIVIESGTGAGQQRATTVFNSTTEVLTITPNWNIIPDNTTIEMQTNAHAVTLLVAMASHLQHWTGLQGTGRCIHHGMWASPTVEPGLLQHRQDGRAGSKAMHSMQLGRNTVDCRTQAQ
jgi:hypothetical protein